MILLKSKKNIFNLFDETIIRGIDTFYPEGTHIWPICNIIILVFRKICDNKIILEYIIWNSDLDYFNKTSENI